MNGGERSEKWERTRGGKEEGQRERESNWIVYVLWGHTAFIHFILSSISHWSHCRRLSCLLLVIWIVIIPYSSLQFILINMNGSSESHLIELYVSIRNYLWLQSNWIDAIRFFFFSIRFFFFFDSFHFLLFRTESDRLSAIRARKKRAKDSSTFKVISCQLFIWILP